MEGEVCFILEASKHGESGRMSKGQPLTPSLGQELLNWSSRGVYTEEGGYMQKQHSHLEVGHERSDQRHLGCFKYRVNVFAFLEAGSQNCGADVMITSGHHAVDFYLAGVSVSIRRLTGYGLDHYLQTLRRN